MAIQYNSNFDLTIPFSDVCAQIGLAANVEQSFIVPGTENNKYSAKISFNATSNVFVCLNDIPAIPALGTVGEQQYNEFRAGDDRSQRYVKGGDVLYFITPDASAYVGVSLRALPG